LAWITAARAGVGYDRSNVRAAVSSLLLVGCFDSAPTIDDGESDGAESEDGPTVAVRGRLSTGIGGVVATPGIKIELVDAPDVFAITDDQGAFELIGVPAGGPRFFKTPPTSEHVGGIVGVDVQFADVEGVLLPRASRLDVAGVVDALEMQDSSIEYDTQGGALLVTSTRTDTRITLDPMPAPGNFYALDAGGAPLLDATASTYWLLPVVVYFNLAEADTGELVVSASHTMFACTVPLAEVPIVADHLSLLSATCN
jgi:hypothetical protein